MRDSQVPREVDIESVLDRQVVAEQLQRDDVQQALQAVDGLRHADGFDVGRDSVVILVADDDGLRLARGDLRECGLHLGEIRVTGHDDDDGHVLVDEGKGTVLQFAGQDTLRMHVADFLDFERTLEAGGVSEWMLAMN